MRYFHGGVRGLRAGQLILPPSAHKGPTLARYADQLAIGTDPKAKELLESRMWVFVAPVRKVARVFAALYPGGGALYQVEPIGRLIDDPDCPGSSYACPRALIIAVYDAFVPFDPSQVLKLVPAKRRRFAFDVRAAS